AATISSPTMYSDFGSVNVWAAAEEVIAKRSTMTRSRGPEYRMRTLLRTARTCRFHPAMTPVNTGSHCTRAGWVYQANAPGRATVGTAMVLAPTPLGNGIGQRTEVSNAAKRHAGGP